MAKFNVVQKKMRAATAERKRAVHGNPLTKKLKQRAQPLSISGKRKQKLFKQWRREQKEAVEKGLITMQDVEMAVTDANFYKPPARKFHIKKKMKTSSKGKNKRKSNKAADPSKEDDAMEE